MKENDLAIIIVNYHSSNKIASLIDALNKFAKNKTHQIIIVDNSDERQILQALAEKHSNVINVAAPYNMGFGRACNLGVARSNSNYILFLNPDIKITNNSIFNFIEYHKKIKERLGFSKGFFLGGRLNNEKGDEYSSHGLFPTIYEDFLSLIGRPIFSTPEKLIFQNEFIAYQVDYVSGAMMFVSRADFIITRGFDESFFLYYEETDLQFRMSLKGWHSLYVPDITAIHENGGTHVSSASRDRYILDGKKNYIRLHFNGIRWFTMQVFLALYHIKWSLRRIMRKA